MIAHMYSEAEPDGLLSKTQITVADQDRTNSMTNQDAANDQSRLKRGKSPETDADRSETNHDSETPDRMSYLLKARDQANEKEFISSRESLDMVNGLVEGMGQRRAGTQFEKGPVNVDDLKN